MESKTFTVPSIGCAGCVRTIQTEVGQIPGVQQIEGDVVTKIVTVQWSAPATWQQIENKLTEIEYAPALS